MPRRFISSAEVFVFDLLFFRLRSPFFANHIPSAILLCQLVARQTSLDTTSQHLLHAGLLLTRRVLYAVAWCQVRGWFRRRRICPRAGYASGKNKWKLFVLFVFVCVVFSKLHVSNSIHSWITELANKRLLTSLIPFGEVIGGYRGCPFFGPVFDPECRYKAEESRSSD